MGLSVLAAVSCTYNSKSWKVQSTSSRGGGLRPWCGRWGVLLIKKVYVGRFVSKRGFSSMARGVRIHWSKDSYHRRCTRGMLWQARKKCDWKNSCNVNSKWLEQHGGCGGFRRYPSVRLWYTCIRLKQTHGGRDRCSHGRLYVAQ